MDAGDGPRQVHPCGGSPAHRRDLCAHLGVRCLAQGYLWSPIQAVKSIFSASGIQQPTSVMLRSSQAPPDGDASVCSGVGMSVLRAAERGWKLSADAPRGSRIIEMRKTPQPGTTQRSAILA